MQNLSRRSLFGGVAAAAVAAILPATGYKGRGFYQVTAGPPMPKFIVGEIEPVLLDLRPGAMYWLQTPERNWFDISLDESAQ